MHAIYASKLYRASKNKDKIRAALANPINSELVLQLKEYLNEDDLADIKKQAESKEAATKSDARKSDEDKAEEKEVIRPSQHSEGSSHAAPSKPSAPDHHLSEEVSKFEEARDAELFDEKKTFDVQKSSDDTSEQVEESTCVSKTAIKANSDVVTIDALQGALNAQADTAGVCRIIRKDAELWVHYSDSVNLNNVMEPVIALLNASNYSYLDFNRLARTENAIVFTISETPKPVEPIAEESNV